MDLKENISAHEIALARKLKSYCTPFGDEIKSKLRESTEILYEMGKIYLEKAKITQGMLQKLNFIKCSALLNGVIVRFKILNNVLGTLNTIETLREMNIMLIEASNAKDASFDLYKISKDVSDWLQCLRKTEKTDLAKLSTSNEEDLTDVGWQDLQIHHTKIYEIRSMMERNTRNYKEIMHFVSEKCVQILGEAPCKFTVVGLGSLARDEITLYSDFEHVIILQEGIQYSSDYHNVRDYFRWFAVIFQVIIIGIGETFIRSVGVKSINDLYSGDKSKNWYYDVFTPSGVSFDGRVPHSCNTPLGRQEPTEKYTHVVELIQPVMVMVTFLLSESHLKNGYYLKDLLARTCFVYGDENVYKLFDNVSKWILDAQRLSKEEFSKSLQENINIKLQGKFFVISGTYNYLQDVKQMFYRPLTALLSCVDRLQNFHSTTTWDTISALMKSEIISNGGFNKLRFALAIACELRLKLYSTFGNQRQKLSQSEVVHLVGKQNALHCALNYAKFHSFVRPLIYPDEIGTKVPERLVPFFDQSVLVSFYALGYWEDAAKVLLKMLEILEQDDHGVKNVNSSEVRYNLASLYSSLYEHRKSSHKERVELLNKVEHQLSYLENDSSIQYDVTLLLSNVYFRRQMYEKVVEIVEKNSIEFKRNLNHQLLYLISMLECRTPEIVLEFCCKGLSETNDNISQMCFEFGRSLAKVKMKKELEKGEFFHLVSKAEENIAKIQEQHIPLLFGMLYYIPSHSRKWDDTLSILNLADRVLESLLISVDPLSINDEVYLMCVLECYTQKFNKEKNNFRKLDYVLKILTAYQEFVSRSAFITLPEKYITTYYITSWAAVAFMPEDVLESYFPEISKVISQTPEDLSNMHTVSIDQARIIFKILFSYEERVRNGKLFELCREMVLVLSHLQKDLCHQLYNEWVTLLRDRVCSKLVESWYERHFCGKLKEGPSYLWKLIVKNNSRKLFLNTEKLSINMIFEMVSITPLIKCLWQSWNNFIKTNSEMMYMYQITQEFNKAATLFSSGNLEISAALLWRLIHVGKITTTLKFKSLIMFIDSIVLINSSHLLIKF
uniref:uncharacterized protein LOC120334227 n=1 Tax=Styela clava TaxID=7725 RepID=UPI001939B7B8|nr:uncharacterized protein LOC120334227 [Styela clava]